MKKINKISVAQLGSRMHYAIPKIFYRNNLLSLFYTDLHSSYIPKNLSIKLRNYVPNSIKIFLQRNVEIPLSNIISFPIFGYHYFKDRKNISNIDNEFSVYLKAGEVFNKYVNSAKWFEKSDAIYLFNTASYECAIIGKKNNKEIILEQCIIPAISNFHLLDNEVEKFPDWVHNPNLKYTNSYSAMEYANKEKEEWKLADKILAPSNFVKELLIKDGASEEKIKLVPYGVEFPARKPKGFNIKNELNILCVGTVDIRKGVQYFYNVAKKYKYGNFRYVGNYNSIPMASLNKLKECVDITGHVDKSTLMTHYKWADVFLFLSIGEGSATVIYEAMSYGLPVITTYQSGSIITHELNGFIVNPDDSDMIISFLEIVKNNKLSNDFLLNVNRLKDIGSLESYEERLINTLDY